MNPSSWRFIPYSVHSGSENMAIDEAMFLYYNDFKINTIRLYGWNPSTVSIGRNQAINNEVHVDFAKSNNIDIVRRISGGGTVFHDSIGEITYSVILTKDLLQSQGIEASYYEISNLVFSPLQSIGLTFEQNAIHCPSLFIKGKKISGGAQARSNNVILQHGTILVDFRPELMYQVLKAKPGKSSQQMVQSVFQYMTTITAEKGEKVSISYLNSILEKGILSDFPFPIEVGELNTEEKETARMIEKEKYSNSDWTFKM